MSSSRSATTASPSSPSIANPIECLTFADLYALMGPESDAVANWNDAEALAQQLGSTTDLPDAALSITAPGDESGTYDSFVELALGDLVEAQFAPTRRPSTRTRGCAPRAASTSPRATTTRSSRASAALPTRSGFVGLAYAEESIDQVKILGVDGGEGCVRREPRNGRRWHLSHLATAVHLPQPHARREQSGDRELRRLTTSPTRASPTLPRPATSTCRPKSSRPPAQRGTAPSPRRAPHPPPPSTQAGPRRPACLDTAKHNASGDT